jgi:hypothetical protein
LVAGVWVNTINAATIAVATAHKTQKRYSRCRINRLCHFVYLILTPAGNSATDPDLTQLNLNAIESRPRRGSAMRRALILALVGMITAGCLETDEPSQSYFLRPQPTGTLPPMSPASTDAAVRVDTMGRRLLAANPAIGAKPTFHTIGAPQAEIFHRGTGDIFVTEGLVRQCSSDGQLASVMALEMGKIVREREAATPDKVRVHDTLPPIDQRFGSDDQFGGTADRTNWKELHELDKERKNRRNKPLPLPDPQVLAKDYVMKAGFTAYDMETARPILEGAAANTALEKQITAPPATAGQPY